MVKYAIIFLGILAVIGYAIYVLAPHAVKPSQGVSRKRWGYLFGGMFVAQIVLYAIAPAMNWWIPIGVSTYSQGIDTLFYVILAVTGVTFIGVGLVFIYELFKFPADPNRRALYTHGNHRLEMLWTAIPGVMLFLLAIGQIPAWKNVKLHDVNDEVASKALQMELTARQWEWRVRYPSVSHMAEWNDDHSAAMKDVARKLPPRPDDVRLVNEVHCVKGKMMWIHLRTQDVIHSFFLPHIRLKQDALPGKTLLIWFEPTAANCEKVGNEWVDGRRHDEKKGWVNDPEYVWELACAEYCGSRHSLMRGKLFVHETQEDYNDWLKSAEAYSRQTKADAK
jgi:cytochrome c oxidase subunit II